MTVQPGRVIVVGESVVDVVERAGQSVEHVGGSPLNVAVGLARLGASVDLVTAVGPDAYGDAIRRHVAKAGARLIDRSAAPEQRSGTATAVIQADGSAHYRFDITWDIDPVQVGDASTLHAGSIGATLRPGRERVAELFSSVGDDVLRSFDPNIRPAVAGSREDVVDAVTRIARRCHVVKMSDEDARWLHPGESAETVTARYRALGIPVVIITMGERGYMLHCGEHLATARADRVDVVDTIGAGDSFMAGLLFALHTSPRTRASVLSGAARFDLIAPAAAFAAQCAAITVGRAGADLPRLPDVPREALPIHDEARTSK